MRSILVGIFSAAWLMAQSAGSVVVNGAIVTGTAGNIICTMAGANPPNVTVTCQQSGTQSVSWSHSPLPFSLGSTGSDEAGLNSIAWQTLQVPSGVAWQITANDAFGSGLFSTSNLTPSITSISPSSAVAGSPAFTLAVDGSQVSGSSVVQWNGSGRTTTFISVTRLTANIAASDISAVGTAQVSVFTPAPGGGTSSSLPFTILAAPPPPPPPPTNITLIQHAGRDGGNTSSASLAFPAAQVAGSKNIVVARLGAQPTSVSVADSHGNTYALVMSKANGSDHILNFYMADNPLSGANTVTISKIGGSTIRFAIQEYSGLASGADLDMAISSIGNSAVADSGMVQTSQPIELMVGAVANTNTGTESVSAQNGFVIDDVIGGSNSPLVVGHLILSTVTATSARFNLSSPIAWICGVVSLK